MGKNPESSSRNRIKLGCVLLSVLSLGAPGCRAGAPLNKAGAADNARIPRHRLYTRDYAAELRRLERRQARIKATDATFPYAPAVLRPVQAGEVKRGAAGELHIAGEIIVGLRAGQADTNLLRQLKRAGIESRLVGYVPAFRMAQVRLNDDSDAVLERIRRLPAVRFVARHGVRSARQVPARKLPHVNKHVWQVLDFRVHAAWSRSNGRGVRVAILDSGLDPASTEFKGRIVEPYSIVTRSETFQDGVILREGKPLRVVDHGTAVAGMVAGKTPGVAPGANIMPIQVLGFNVLKGRVITHDLAILAGLARAVEYKADIINLSLGGDFSDLLKTAGPDRRVRSAVVRKMHRVARRNMLVYEQAFRACEERGIPVVVSAGNENSSAGIQPLASHPYTISVGAMDREGRRAVFSNHGPMVDTFAPGEDVASKGAGNHYQPYSGTSFGAPYVTGLLALARGMKLRAKPSELRGALRATNERVNLSILPGRELPVIAPIAFLNRLGAGLPPVPSGRLQGDFQKQYGAFLVRSADKPRVEMRKILGYFAERGHMYMEWPEALRLRELARDHFDDAYAVFAADSYLESRAFYLMVLMKGVKLSRAQLARLSAIRHKDQGEDYNHDYMAELFRAHGYKPAVSWMYRRLERSFHSHYTYDAVAELDGPAAFPRLGRLLKKLHAAPVWKRGRGLGAGQLFSNEQVYNLTALVKSAGVDKARRRRAHALARISHERYLKRRPFAVRIRGAVILMDGNRDADRFGIWMRALMAFAGVFLEFQDKRFLGIVVDALEQVERRRGNPGNGINTAYWYKQIQGMLNKHTDFGFKFNYQESSQVRKQTLTRFRAAARKARFAKGRFRLSE